MRLPPSDFKRCRIANSGQGTSCMDSFRHIHVLRLVGLHVENRSLQLKPFFSSCVASSPNDGVVKLGNEAFYNMHPFEESNNGL